MNRLTLHPAALATTAVLALTVYVLQNFLLPMLWAVILAIATWPLYRRLEQRLGPTRASIVMTSLIAVCTIVPLALLSNLAIHEVSGAIDWMRKVSREGFAYPQTLDNLPGSATLREWWEKNLAQPTTLGEWTGQLMSDQLYEMSHLLQVSSFWVLHRVANLFFCFISLFFFFRDGDTLGGEIEAFCRNRLGEQWVESLRRIPLAIRATVDGVVLIGVVIGLLVGFGYAAVDVRSPVLLGALTAVAAMIPLAAPLVYGVVALYLFFLGEILNAVLLFAWSHAVFFVFDHFVRPIMIGNTTRMPFLLVLFGILGGVETMGLVGLFVGPVAMVLLLTWWNTATEPEPPLAHAG